ncbi:amino acid ABC transporter ATP-binding/permease protein [Anaerococcus tetradius]|uniref:amino acid ABC transporter ATP-binding/permease protein n=1 Tax=Anaerococcus tetradius TaxID=33036 RepID=UPI0023F4D83A|nr:ABC transporter ATP-binding protein [Anaerococcus tetradius]
MKNRRSGFLIMKNMLSLVGDLYPLMILAVFIGSLGHLCASFVTIFAGFGLLAIIKGANFYFFIKVILSIAVFRGIFHYIEQYLNHYLAFKILAKIRHLVFKKMRKLAPAKLCTKERGKLISLITSDVELLEVFYAHTISPIAIAICYMIFMLIFISRLSIYQAGLAFLAYLAIGCIIPLYIGKLNKDLGLLSRNKTGELNSFVLERIRNLYEVKQFKLKEETKEKLIEKSRALKEVDYKINKIKSLQEALTTGLVLLSSLAMLILSIYLYKKQIIGLYAIILASLSILSSFGPFIALANLGNFLAFSLASADRLLDLLEESPIVEENLEDRQGEDFIKANIKNISFAYKNEEIIKDFSLPIEKGKILGLYGKSGCGKSTILRLLMRFWDVDKGEISINDDNIKNIPSKNLRKMQSLLAQDTYIFNISIEDNIRLAKLDATKEEIIEASKKASIHDFIVSLPNSYKSLAGEVGSGLSAGERQRIGVARAFLHDSELMLFDEPTSNLDILNEIIILKSIKESSKDKTILLVSHSLSSLSIADQKIKVGDRRKS